MAERIYTRAKLLPRAVRCMEDLSKGQISLSGGEQAGVPDPEKLKTFFRYTARFLRRELEGRPQPGEDLPVLKRSVRCLYRLSCGRDPFSAERLPRNSPLAEKSLTVCFRYSYLVLRSAALPPVRDPDSVPPELLERVAYSEEPLRLSEFLRPLNELLGYTLDSNFLRYLFSGWLVREDYIGTVRTDIGTESFPTEKGQAAGIIDGEGENQDGERFRCCLYTEEAQHMLVDHIDEVFACGAADCDALLECLTPEVCFSLELLGRQVSVRNILNRLYDLLPPGTPRVLISARVYAWMEKKGLIRTENQRRVPTPKGEELGIRRNGWNASAQKYLVDHLREIVRDIRSGEAFRPSDGG